MEYEYMDRNSDHGITIDVREIFVFVMKRFWHIMFAGILTGLIAIVISKVWISPLYESYTKVFVLTRTNEDNFSYSDMYVSSSLTQDYQEIFLSHSVIEKTLAMLHLDETYEQLIDRVTITASSTNTRILTIRVLAGSPKEASDLAATLRDVAIERTLEIVNGSIDISIISDEITPENRISPSFKKNALLGGFLGAFICGLIILGQYFSDNTIKNQNDIKKYLNIVVLGNIPLSKGRKSSRKKRKHKL